MTDGLSMDRAKADSRWALTAGHRLIECAAADQMVLDHIPAPAEELAGGVWRAGAAIGVGADD